MYMCVGEIKQERLVVSDNSKFDSFKSLYESFVFGME